MEKNFEGKQFQITSHNQPSIDCMFFPATHGDNITVDPECEQNDSDITKKYLFKSTIIMCNPNALIY
jgi:pimeloyl-ACP methyl ester carboxylesterase